MFKWTKLNTRVNKIYIYKTWQLKSNILIFFQFSENHFPPLFPSTGGLSRKYIKRGRGRGGKIKKGGSNYNCSLDWSSVTFLSDNIFKFRSFLELDLGRYNENQKTGGMNVVVVPYFVICNWYFSKNDLGYF